MALTVNERTPTLADIAALLTLMEIYLQYLAETTLINASTSRASDSSETADNSVVVVYQRLHPPAAVFMEAVKSLDSLLLGVEYKLCGILIKKMEEMYVKLVCDTSKYGKKVRRLEKNINDPQQYQLKKLNRRPVVGEIVLASWHGRYKRAKCLDNALSTIPVVFMDDPILEVKSVRSLRAIQPDMLEIPFLMRRCQLVNIGPLHSCNETSLLESLKALTGRVNGLALKKVSDFDREHPWIELTSTYWGNIGSKLIEMGVAVERIWFNPSDWGPHGIPG